ncbi:tyrosine-type recombinase/integrase [Christiangramia sabulilitoris]|uniref:Site-specific integrase n=1 Tax=Christiangramia sabulilitoris TaxID=2583991 RepID=A0A550I3E9_9FLAO|nr:tyrosine-type recombinase/integrase [Christiangramia sabulilitoris]TRO65495.1 site-specific integrase [Christiangramia sabulilitoris]
MATVNFLYRSKKEKAPVNLRLLFRYNEKDNVIGGKTQEIISKDYWQNFHDKKRIKDIEMRNLQTEVNQQLSKLESFILDEYYKSDPSRIDKPWLESVISNFYNPNQTGKEIPKDLIGYIEYYLDYRKNEISKSNVKKVNIAKNKMLRLQKELRRTIYIKDINEGFKKAYVDFSNKHNYSQNTQQRELVLIKTICFHAKHLGLDIHHQLDGLKLQREEVKHIYLTPEEIEKVEKLKLKEDYLNNARDWLLISYFTGQRVSDFMRFTKDMIRREDGKFLLEFRQKKTKKLMSIPFTKKAREVTEKYNGNFPRAISAQKYNDYIKIVCKKAQINEEVQGKRRVSIAPDGVTPTKNDYRDILDTFKKWELVTSHIGRRSFATNHYGRVPTTYLRTITGHTSEKAFLNYIKKSNKDLALDAYNYFE